MALAIWAVLAILQLGAATGSSAPISNFPAIFVFGDSLSDSGNNNHLLTLAKANYYPNGIDFPDGPTGRFSNGFTTIDHLATKLGFPLIPPFNNLATKGAKILKGVNYASGSAGILDDTGNLFGNCFTMDEQIENFQITIDEMRVELGKTRTSETIAKSLIVVGIGSNDFILNYLLPTSKKRLIYTVDQFINLLIQKFTKQLEILYELGGRRFFVTGIPPIGCIPKAVGLSNVRGCVDSSNQMAINYNKNMQPLLIQLKKNLPGSNFVYGDIFFSTKKMINNPSAYGFKYTNEACCTLDLHRSQIPCLPILSFKCRNRSEYVFWDAFHPTHAVAKITAEQLLPLVKSLL